MSVALASLVTMSSSLTPVPTGGKVPARKDKPVSPRVAAITVGSMGLVLVVVQLINFLMRYRLNPEFGIISRQVSGLDGILAAPLLHASWGHLLSNLIPMVIFGFLILIGGARQFVLVTVLVWILSGVGVWLLGPSNTVTVGASALVFGWFTFLLSRGIFTRNVGQIVIGAILFLIWGGLFWTGIIKIAVGGGDSTVSWQGHLFGAAAGVLAAFVVARSARPKKPAITSPGLPALPL